MLIEPVDVEHSKENSEVVILHCGCTYCGKITPLKVSRDGYIKRFIEHELIQHCFPELSPEERELLVSGTCPKCWDNMFGKLEED